MKYLRSITEFFLRLLNFHHFLDNFSTKVINCVYLCVHGWVLSVGVCVSLYMSLSISQQTNKQKCIKSKHNKKKTYKQSSREVTEDLENFKEMNFYFPLFSFFGSFRCPCNQ